MKPAAGLHAEYMTPQCLRASSNVTVVIALGSRT
jgi:hypothetical protein